jgi:hypothetical protein
MKVIADYTNHHSTRTSPMPTLDWIGKQAVLNHHNTIPFHLLRCKPELSQGEKRSGRKGVFIMPRAQDRVVIREKALSSYCA